MIDISFEKYTIVLTLLEAIVPKSVAAEENCNFIYKVIHQSRSLEVPWC